jgi:hypothetical protein
MRDYLNKSLTIIFALLSLTIFPACQSEDKKEDCDDLSMMCYRGFPRKCNKLKKTCSNAKIKYTAELCQKAFNDLLLGREYKQVTGVYGERIAGCFNEREIQKYKK